ncbi:hypothetical protein MBLNU457_7438t1 [Dothideomycetes sp. NU457]
MHLPPLPPQSTWSKLCATISSSPATATTIWLLYAYAFVSLALLLCLYGSGKIDRWLNILPLEPPARRRRAEFGNEEYEAEFGMRRMGML